MLLDFRFENTRSYRKENHLPLWAKGTVSRAVAIYGANASGKTGVVEALSTMRNLVLGSARVGSTDELPISPFKLAEEPLAQPTLLELAFVLEARVYRYGFAATATRIESEWLYRSENIAAYEQGVETPLFVREGERLHEGSESAKALLSRTLPNVLLLSKLDQDNDGLAKAMMRWMRCLTIVHAYSDDAMYGYSHAHLFHDPAYQTQIMDLMRYADTTIADCREIDSPPPWEVVHDEQLRKLLRERFPKSEPKEVAFLRKSADGTQRLLPLSFQSEESAGTKKMFCIAGPLVDILRNGYTLIVDELDSKLHPLLVQKIVSLFVDERTNPHGAQLIFTTHDVELIRSGLLAPHHIFFSEKNLQGESFLYSLQNFRTASGYANGELAERYLRGVFGAVPVFETTPKETP